MHRRTVVFGLIALYATVCRARAAAWALITKDEFERDSLAPHPVNPLVAAPPGAPTIKVEQPDETLPIKPPVTIRISFLPKAGATIDPASFHATYGWLGIDITGRILEHTHVSASGLLANNVNIPAGHHKVTIQIADNMHRVGIRTFEFTVL